MRPGVLVKSEPVHPTKRPPEIIANKSAYKDNNDAKSKRLLDTARLEPASPSAVLDVTV